MKIIQQQSFLVSSILLSCFLGAMEREVPQVSTAVTVAQEELPPNPLLKEFFVKSDMFEVKTDIPKTLPSLIPSLCKKVSNSEYTETALGLVRFDWYPIAHGKYKKISLCSNFTSLRFDGLLGRSNNYKDVFYFGIENFSLDSGYCIQDFSTDQKIKYMYKHKDICPIGSGNYEYDGVNKYGYLINLIGNQDQHSFSILTCNNPQKIPQEPDYCLPEYCSEAFQGKATAFKLHYASNRVGICSFDYTTNAAKICVYDCDMLLKTKDKKSLITWRGVLPERFKKCIFVSDSTLFGITMDGKLYSMALENDTSISVHRQVLKDLDKNDLLMKDMSADFMHPRRIVFIDKDDNLYLIDLESKKNIFVKIQDSLSRSVSFRSIEYLWCGDNKIYMQYLGTKYSGGNPKAVVQNFDYIPF